MEITHRIPRYPARSLHTRMMHRSLLLFLFALPAWLCAQVFPQDSLMARHAALHAALARLDTITDDELAESDWDINPTVGALLIRLLETPGLTDQQVDSLVPPSELYRVRSADGRLCIFSWDERTGGTFRSQVSVVFQRLPTGEVQGVYSTTDSDDWNKGGSYSEIHPLPSDSVATLYACVGQVIGCSTCCGDMLTVIQLTDDAINFNYPAFALKGADGQSNGAFTTTFLLTTRCGGLLEFAYEPFTSVLTYSYVADDLTPVVLENWDDHLEIKGHMRFTGEWFEEE